MLPFGYFGSVDGGQPSEGTLFNIPEYSKDTMINAFNYLVHDADCLVILGPLLFLPVFLRLYRHILLRNETRTTKAVIQDPILDALPTYDTSLIITASSLVSTVVFIYIVIENESTLSLVHTASHLLCVFYMISLIRMVCIMLCPLKQHAEGILLRDHFIQCIAGESMSTRHDLMFSGHMAQQVFYLCYTPQYETFFFFMSIQSALALLLGKIHYTIDIIVGWCVTRYICDMFPLSEYKMSDGLD